MTMERLSEAKIILVKRKTRLDDLVARFNTVMQAQFYIEHLDQDFSDYLTEHKTYIEAVELAVEVLKIVGRLQVVDRAFLPNFLFGKDDIVVAVGQDGLVANTLKYLRGQALIGVNPDPARWDGVLLPFQTSDLRQIVPELLAGKRPIRDVTIGKATLNDGQTLLAVNDFFIGQKTHASARYKIALGEAEEMHSSSGIIVSTGLGASGWLKSVLAGAAAISSPYLSKPLELRPSAKFTWDADYLCYSVREPFPSRTTQASMVFGTFRNETPLRVASLMGENGVIFSDGIEHDFLSFNSGIEAVIGIAEHKGRLVG